MPSDCTLTWDNETWLKRFHATGADYRALRREVWENTREIVEVGGYSLPDGDSVLLSDKKRYSQFYYKPFRASFEQLGSPPPEITVVPDDCLDVAHRWVEEAMRLKGECNDIAVLNMASRRNPGGGVTNGAGAQEEYLFRCSDYHKYLYCYASYAEQYNLTRSHYQYPLDENFGGILSQNVTVFRENEDTGYRLISKPWQVNMIAVAGMNSPRLVWENGEERIAPNLVEGVKNKIRTIFRIACDRGQRNLVLGALGCGAFHNPPKHVAELFRDVLCEEEFWGAFQKICFAVKTSHTSKGNTNFSAFKETLDGFVPVMKNDHKKARKAKEGKEATGTAKTAEDYFYDGLVAMREMNHDKAVENFSHAIELKSDFALAFITRGSSYARRGDIDLAIADYTQSIAINPNEYLPFYNRGILYASKGNDELAIADYNRAIELNPNDADPYSTRGNWHYDMGNYDQAISDYKRALALDSNNVKARDGLQKAQEAKEGKEATGTAKTAED